MATFNQSYNAQVIKALATITDVPTTNISVNLKPAAAQGDLLAAAAAGTQPGPAGGNRKLKQQDASLNVFAPAGDQEQSAQPESGGAPAVATDFASLSPSTPAPSTTPSPAASAAPTGVAASYTLNGDDATAVARSLKQSAASGAMTGLLQELGVTESGPGAAAAAAAIGGNATGLALPSMSISGSGPDDLPEAVPLNPVALTANTPQPLSGTPLSAAVTTTSTQSTGSSSSSSSSSTMFGWGLPDWAVITILAAGSALVVLGLCGICCCFCVMRRKKGQEEDYEQFCQKRRTRQQQQLVASASQSNKEREDAVLLNKTNADVDVVLHTP